MRKRTNKPIPLFQQEAALKSFFPDSKISRKSDSEITWTHTVKPTPLSAAYTLLLHYKKTDGAKVYVVSPKPLRLAEGKDRLPHVYNQAEQRLCLYFPITNEWNPSMLYVKTLIPWACEWLMHYEIWVGTGEWKGGGIEHDEENNEEEEEKEEREN
ncbi:hypothetical protein FHS59_003294 [Algoriphagus iocasae]|uniref:Type II CBASS E2 protein domain-containing protein n=1 Tax=Algoriphagus iocasae TaxID=1836499 RepID=A0A841N0A8_9BACT|nr:hypothetical protein [Algoriphagus iocasae]MBB6327651.1 hypothetical protein [Algoriphagus iocasae]